MRQVECERHVVIGLVGSIAEHHTLVSGTLLFGVGTAHTHIDVLTLGVQRGQNTATLRLELVLGFGITDIGDRLADDLLDVHPSVTTHLAGNDDLTGSTKGLAGYVSLRILCQHVIQNSVRNLVAYFVRVSFGHRF